MSISGCLSLSKLISGAIVRNEVGGGELEAAFSAPRNVGTLARLQLLSFFPIKKLL